MITQALTAGTHYYRNHRLRGLATLAGVLLAVIVLLPALETLARPLFGQGIAGSINFVRHATLWFGYVGALLAARKSRHIAIGISSFLGLRGQRVAKKVANSLAVVTCMALCVAAFDMVMAERQSQVTLGGFIPIWMAQSVMPVSFALLALRYSRQLLSETGPLFLAILVSLAALAGVFLDFGQSWVLPLGAVAIFIATLAGAPLFIVLGALAALLFAVEDVPLASISVEAYRIASNPILPTIPLFTLAGTILASGRASERLVDLFSAWVGWLPGGTAVAAICVCAFFTTFTGGSGVTILALGGLMLPVLVKQQYGKSFSLGAITASGSLGILLPPSMLVILYGVASQTPIDRLFVAGLLPGLLLILMMCGYAVFQARRRRLKRIPFDRAQAWRALRAAKWEILLPVGVLYGIFSGLATLVEVAAMAVIYTLVLEVVIHRELRSASGLLDIASECAVLVGGIKIILASAMGLTSYLIYADVPTLAADFIQSVTHSPWVFLLALNVALLLAGCLLDIISAIVVVVPLMLPVATAFGIDPVHLGIIFLANMELGYLTPPVGMNLYLSSFRFERPLLAVFRSALPFFLINAIAVLVITFVPAISTGFAKWLLG